MIDNGSRDRTCAIVRETRPDAQLLCNPDNRGVAPARNQGIRLSQGEYILILDDDTVVQPGALDSLIRYMENQPKVGLCGPKLAGADGELQLSCRRFPTLIDKLTRRLPLMLAQNVNRKVEMADWDHRTIRAGRLCDRCLPDIFAVAPYKRLGYSTNVLRLRPGGRRYMPAVATGRLVGGV